MERLKLFVGQRAFLDISEEIKEGNFSHAYIIESKDGFSSFEFARLISLRFNCENLCGNCPHCLKILCGTHPDTLIFPEKDRFLVSDSRAIIEKAALRPLLSKYKIFIIDKFDNATEEAQNKILKLVEEPGPDTIFLICTKNILRILPTIRSRCRQVLLSPLPIETIQKFVKNRNAVDFGEGWLGISSELDGHFDLACDGACRILSEMKTSSRLVYYSRLLTSEKKDLLLRLKVLAQMLEDLLYIKEGREEYARMRAYTGKLRTVCGDYSREAIVNICDLISKASREFEANVNKEILVENLLMKILEVKFLCK